MIKHINYKGEKYPMRIGYKALKGVFGDLGRDFRGGDPFDYEGAECLLYHGLKQGASFTGESFELKKGQMEDILEESMSDFLASFEAFSQPPQGGAES